VAVRPHAPPVAMAPASQTTGAWNGPVLRNDPRPPVSSVPLAVPVIEVRAAPDHVVERLVMAAPDANLVAVRIFDDAELVLVGRWPLGVRTVGVPETTTSHSSSPQWK